jgi:acetoin utilization deacetylase AcuC-like enzyme
MHLYYDPIYTDGIHPDARFPRHRYKAIAQLLAAEDAGQLVTLLPPVPATRDDLVEAHDAAYVDAFLDFALDPKVIRRIGLRPWTEAIIDRTLLLTGGSLAALDDALDTNGYAGNMAGGTHHAFHDHGAGYCIVNDIAICAHRARRRGLRRIAVVDLDVHQGDGTASMFADDPDVFTFSMHCQANFPFRKQASDLDVPLPKGMGDDAYLETLDAHLPQVLAQEPELLLYQAGVDPLADDRLGKLELTHTGLHARNTRVFDAADARGIPVVVFMGGGYAEPIDPSVRAFVDLFLEAGRRHRARVS